jgi:hypothetical protein
MANFRAGFSSRCLLPGFVFHFFCTTLIMTKFHVEQGEAADTIKTLGAQVTKKSKIKNQKQHLRTPSSSRKEQLSSCW